MEMKLDKKQLWAIFLFEFKMGHKAAETTHNINSVFGPETANKYCSAICFCKGDKSLADEGLTGQPTEVDSDQLGGNSGADPLQLNEELPKNFSEANWKGEKTR